MRNNLLTQTLIVMLCTVRLLSQATVDPQNPSQEKLDDVTLGVVNMYWDNPNQQPSCIEGEFSREIHIPIRKENTIYDTYIYLVIKGNSAIDLISKKRATESYYCLNDGKLIVPGENKKQRVKGHDYVLSLVKPYKFSDATVTMYTLLFKWNDGSAIAIDKQVSNVELLSSNSQLAIYKVYAWDRIYILFVGSKQVLNSINEKVNTPVQEFKYITGSSSITP